MKHPIAIAVKITLLIISFVIVLFGIYYVKTKGIGENAQRILGIYPEDRQIKAKIIDFHTPKNIPAPSQNKPSNRNKLNDNY
ncbi:MAG: hypothetical protein KDD58_01340 [Bdellovibrionales bacterium]|nr:hypothetical protein [Bdellovibrionales bacterium]